MSPTDETISRRRFLGLAGAALVAAATARAAPDRSSIPAVGVIVPTETSRTRLAPVQVAGAAATLGAMLAEDRLAADPLAPVELTVLPANAPTPDAARRAAERMLAVQDVVAIVGGVGDGQAAVLDEVATRFERVFFNVGDQSEATRSSAGSLSFHVEASAPTYLDATIHHYLGVGSDDWLFVLPDTQAGRALGERAAARLQASGAGSVEHRYVPHGRLVYGPELDVVRATAPDLVVLGLGLEDQEAFLAQFENARIDVPVAAFPHPATQTRFALASLAATAPRTSRSPRVALWDTTLQEPVAHALNERFTSRWGRPLDPSGWAAYQAVRMFGQAFHATGSTDGRAVASYLVDAGTTFDVAKGYTARFDPSDRQLRQSLYVIAIAEGADTRIGLTRQEGVARVLYELEPEVVHGD